MEARDHRRIARENLAGNWWLSVAVAFVAGLFGATIVTGGASFNLNIDEELLYEMPPIVLTYLKIVGSVGGILGLVQFILGGTIQLGYATYLLKQYDREHFEFADLFSQLSRIGQGFAQAFLRGLYVFLWTLLFIIPGIVKSFSYAMTPFIMAENPNMTANESITASRQMMDGHKGELFWLELTFIGWSLLCIFTLGIGNLFLNPYTNAAQASFYRNLCPRRTYIE